MIWITYLITFMCGLATYGISTAFHIGLFGTVGIGFIITMVALNVSEVLRR